MFGCYTLNENHNQYSLLAGLPQIPYTAQLNIFFYNFDNTIFKFTIYLFFYKIYNLQYYIFYNLLNKPYSRKYIENLFPNVLA